VPEEDAGLCQREYGLKNRRVASHSGCKLVSSSRSLCRGCRTLPASSVLEHIRHGVVRSGDMGADARMARREGGVPDWHSFAAPE
jgi:hypothetical protein